MGSPTVFRDTFGLMLVGMFLDAILYGIALLLGFQFFRLYATESFGQSKFTILAMILLSTLHIVCLFMLVYQELIINYGDYVAANSIVPVGVPISTSYIQLLGIYLVAFLAQCFYATRIWSFSHKNIWLTGFVMSLALLQISAGIAQTVKSAELSTFDQLATTKPIVIIQSSASAICDIGITVILCWLLHGSRTGIKRTDALVDRLIAYAVNRGALTSLAALINMILFVATPDGFFYMPFIFSSGQLYMISVISSLIARRSLFQEFSGGVHELNASGDFRSSSTRSSFPMPIMPRGVPINKMGPGVNPTKSIVTWSGPQLDAEYGSNRQKKIEVIPSFREGHVDESSV